ncbi:MAG: uL30 family ribosomal protein [Candidatus Micrarchaeota archaeon]|nr:uL30 family ribosomal protein [Candidatus Micrarchaeota archaeon]
MKMELENKLIAVIRVRGTIGVRHDISETLRRLNLGKPNNFTLVFGTKSNLGMIKQCSDFIAYGAISQERLEKILTRKGIKFGSDDVQGLISGKKRARDMMELPIRLHPPRRGYGSIKSPFSKGGALGYHGEEINDLIRRMS